MKCPGQDSRYWKPGAIFEAKCPKCGAEVEFFKDDPLRKCRKCGHRFPNPKMDFGCAAYCPYAEQCIGDLPPEVAAQQESLLKDKVAIVTGGGGGLGPDPEDRPAPARRAAVAREDPQDPAQGAGPADHRSRQPHHSGHRW